MPHKHRWQPFQDSQYKRRCEGCGSIEWLFMSPYPILDIPGLQWKSMDLPRPALRERLKARITALISKARSSGKAGSDA